MHDSLRAIPGRRHSLKRKHFQIITYHRCRGTDGHRVAPIAFCIISVVAMKIDDRTCVQYGRLPELRHPCKLPELRRPAHLRQWRHGLSAQFSSKINKLRYLMMASQGLQMMVELRLPSMTAALQGDKNHHKLGPQGSASFMHLSVENYDNIWKMVEVPGH